MTFRKKERWWHDSQFTLAKARWFGLGVCKKLPYAIMWKKTMIEWDGLHGSVEGKEGGDLMGQKTNPKRTFRTGSLAHF